MGISDREYERSYDTGSGWRDSGGGGGGGGLPGGGGFASWSANSKLLAVMVAVFLAQNFFKGLTDALVLPADWFREPWRVYGLLTYSLLHSTVTINHLLFNGIALFFFGRTINQRLGGREYLTFFFAAAAFAGLAWSVSEVAFDGLAGGRTPVLLGASGGIAAIVVLFALWYPNVQVYIMGVLPIPAWLMAILFIGQDVMGAVSRSGNVAYTAHLGGALFGYFYFRYSMRLSSYLPSWLGGGGPGFGPGAGGAAGGGLASLFKRKPKLRVHRDDEADSPAINPGDERVDEILRKIQAQGQDSLTREEQRILERASRRYQQRR